MSLSGVYGAADDAASVALVQHALDRGITHLDSSDMYGWGHNESLLGRAIRGRREQVILATKFGQVRNPAGGNLVNGRPEYVREACDASLARLGVDVIDLYYQHRVDPAVPIEETVGGMKRLVEAGKVRALGLSEAAPATIRRAHGVHPISAVQSEYSLLYRTEAEETLRTCRELGISYVAYSPLGRGFLTGQIQKPRGHSGGRPPARPSAVPGRQLRPQRGAGASHRGAGHARRAAPPSQLVLAWLLAQGPGRAAHPRHQAEGPARGKSRRPRRAPFATRTSRASPPRCPRAPPPAPATRRAP